MCKQIKVSIIVPVYNAEEHLKECVDSVLAQTLEEFELILIDDGSTDKSPEICDEFAKDPRIRVIHKENAGPGEARNTGLEAATGEFIGFVDADDFVSPNMFKLLYEAAEKENADLAICDFIAQKKDSSLNIKSDNSGDNVYEKAAVDESILPYFFGYTDSEMLHYKSFYPFADYASYIWLCIFRTSVIKDNNIHFESQKTYFNEDNLFNLSVVANSKKIVHIAKYLYFYGDSDSSLTKSYNPDFLKAKVNRYGYLLNFIHKKGLPQNYRKRLRNKICIESINIVNYYVNAKGPHFGEKYKKLREVVNNETIRKALNDLNLKALPFSKIKIFLTFEKKRMVFMMYLLSNAYNLLRK